MTDTPEVAELRDGLKKLSLEDLLRVLRSEAWEKGKEQHDTPYTYTLSDETFLKAVWEEIDSRFKQQTSRIRAEVLESLGNQVEDCINEFGDQVPLVFTCIMEIFRGDSEKDVR